MIRVAHEPVFVLTQSSGEEVLFLHSKHTHSDTLFLRRTTETVFVGLQFLRFMDDNNNNNNSRSEDYNICTRNVI